MRRIEIPLACAVSVTLLAASGCGQQSSPSAVDFGAAEEITQFINSDGAPAGAASHANGVEDDLTDADLWSDLEQESIQLKEKLLIVKGSKGIVACSYLNVETFHATEEACAIVPAADFDAMLDSRVTAVSNEARELGIFVGMSGREALKRIR